MGSGAPTGGLGRHDLEEACRYLSLCGGGLRLGKLVPLSPLFVGLGPHPPEAVREGVGLSLGKACALPQLVFFWPCSCVELRPLFPLAPPSWWCPAAVAPCCALSCALFGAIRAPAFSRGCFFPLCFSLELLAILPLGAACLLS